MSKFWEALEEVSPEAAELLDKWDTIASMSVDNTIIDAEELEEEGLITLDDLEVLKEFNEYLDTLDYDYLKGLTSILEDLLEDYKVPGHSPELDEIFRGMEIKKPQEIAFDWYNEVEGSKDFGLVERDLKSKFGITQAEIDEIYQIIRDVDELTGSFNRERDIESQLD